MDLEQTQQGDGATCRITGGAESRYNPRHQSTRPNWEGRPVRSSRYALGLALASGEGGPYATERLRGLLFWRFRQAIGG